MPQADQQDRIRIAHISDLHFSIGYGPLVPYCHSVKHLVAAEKCIANENPDFVILSGDVSNNGDLDSLLRARDWLCNRLSIGNEKSTGLSLSPDRIGVVPGNHDAWNSSISGQVHVRWQRSLENYDSAFPKPATTAAVTVQTGRPAATWYRWIRVGRTGAFLAFLDSSFCGGEEDGATQRTPFDRIARGKLSIPQSRQLLRWLDQGIAGNLPDPVAGGMIDSDAFARSLKVLVMHHYLFEPRNCGRDYFMEINHRETVTRNVLLAQFDVLLCGHKHHIDARPVKYGEHFDERARARYLLNAFRRLLGLHALPLQLRDRRRRRLKRALTDLVRVLLLRPAEAARPEPGALVDELRLALENPGEFERRLEVLVASERLAPLDLSDDEIRDIGTRIAVAFSPKERQAIEARAKRFLSTVMDGLAERPFVQLMSGSTSKASGESAAERGLNLYDIRRDRTNSTRLEVREFRYRPETTSFEPAGGNERKVYSFADARQVALGVDERSNAPSE